jgi:riboflavin kinase
MGMSKPNQWFLLLKLAELGASTKSIFTSTNVLAREFNCSQQTVSRWLTDLAKLEYIERKIAIRGEYITISQKGVNELTRVYTRLNLILKAEKPKFMMIEGKLFSGLGEGAYYVTRDGYRKQFIKKLGFKPYPGTLNVKLVNTGDINARKELEMLPAIVIDGFSDGARTFGMAKCFPTLINNKIDGAVLLIQRSHYNSSVLEVIAPVFIRDLLKLKDGDTVRLKIFMSPS